MEASSPAMFSFGVKMKIYLMGFYVDGQLVSACASEGNFPVHAWAQTVFGYAYNEAHKVALEKGTDVQWEAVETAGDLKDWTCSNCGGLFRRVKEYSLLGYRQCERCDIEMFHAKGQGLLWKKPDRE